MDVICVGNLNFDITFVLERMPLEHEKLRCRKAFYSYGGSAGNCACWFSVLGLKSSIVATVGDDPLGEGQVQNLKRFGVDTSEIQRRDFSGVSSIFVVGRDKRMVKYEGANRYKFIHESYLKNSKHIHVTSSRREHVEEVLRIAKKYNISFSYDPGETEYLDLVLKSDYVFLNEDEAKRLTKASLEEALEILSPKVLAITLNTGGCLVKEKKIFNIKGFDEEVLDTTGSGDAFASGFIFGILRGWDLRKCGEFGVVLSTLTAKKFGARMACNLDFLKKFLKEKKLDFDIF